MRNFDEARSEREKRDRSFVIGGETFTYKPAVAPEAIKQWSRMVGGEFVLKDEAGKPVLDEKGETVSTLTEDEAIAIFDETVVAFLEPGQASRWAAVRDPDAAHPLNLDDLTQLVRWLFEEQTARPTSPPSASTDGPVRDETETTSTVVSSSPEPVTV